MNGPPQAHAVKLSRHETGINTSCSAKLLTLCSGTADCTIAVNIKMMTFYLRPIYGVCK